MSGRELLFHARRTTPTRDEIGEIVRAARALDAAFQRRSITSQNATLGEEEALMFLKERITALDKRLAGRG